jgi:hypothetical protein
MRIPSKQLGDGASGSCSCQNTSQTQSICYIYFEFLLKSSWSFHCSFTTRFLLWPQRIHDFRTHDYGGFLASDFFMRKASKKLLSCETFPVLTIPNRHNLTELRASPYGTRAEVGQPTKCDRCRTYRIQWSTFCNHGVGYYRW